MLCIFRFTRSSNEHSEKSSPTIRRTASQLTPPSHRRERSLDMGSLNRFADHVTATSSSSSNSPAGRRKTIGTTPVTFNVGDPEEEKTAGHMTSGDQDDDTRRASVVERPPKRGSLRREESEDTINGEADDQSGPGDNVTLSEETVHDVEGESDVMMRGALAPMGEENMADMNRMSPDMKWEPSAR